MSDATNSAPEIGVEIKYCKEDCVGLEGVTHGHFGCVVAGKELGLSPPFPSKQVGLALAEGARRIDDKVPGFSARVIDTVATADLPETSAHDDRTIKKIKAAGSRVWVIDVIIDGDASASLFTRLMSGHRVFQCRTQHGRYGIIVVGCVGCNTSAMAFYVDGALRGYADNVFTVENAASVLVEATKAYDIPNEDASALRAKLSEIFPPTPTAPAE